MSVTEEIISCPCGKEGAELYPMHGPVEMYDHARKVIGHRQDIEYYHCNKCGMNVPPDKIGAYRK